MSTPCKLSFALSTLYTQAARYLQGSLTSLPPCHFSRSPFFSPRFAVTPRLLLCCLFSHGVSSSYLHAERRTLGRGLALSGRHATLPPRWAGAHRYVASEFLSCKWLTVTRHVEHCHMPQKASTQPLEGEVVGGKRPRQGHPGPASQME